MAGEELLAVQLAQVAALAIAGYLAGRLVHSALAALEKSVWGAPGKEAKETFSSRIISEIEGPLGAIFAVLVVFVLSGYALELAELHSLMARYYQPIVIVLAAYLLAKLVEGFVSWRQVREREQNGKASLSLLPLAGKIAAIAIIFWGITFALAATGFDVTSFLAFSGVAAIVIGFAAQETLGNVIAGIALQVEGQYANGEYLRLSNGEVGKLRTIGWRSAEFDVTDKDTIVVPNSELAKQQVTNISRPQPDFRAKVFARLPIEADAGEFTRKTVDSIKARGDLGVRPHEVEVQVKRVARKGYEVEIAFWLDDYFKFDAATDFVNRLLLENRRETPVAEKNWGGGRAPAQKSRLEKRSAF